MSRKAGHKQDCGTGTGSTKELSLKLAERSLSVPDVTHFLAHASILLLELVQKPLNWRNYVIKAVCKTQDADLQAYIQRALSQQPPDENAQVCLFYSALEKVPFDEAPKLTKLTAKRKEESFRKNLRDMDGDLTHGENPIVTYFVTNQNGDGADGAVSLSLVIPMGEVMRMAVTKKLQYRSAMRGEFEVDMSVKNLLECVHHFLITARHAPYTWRTEVSITLFEWTSRTNCDSEGYVLNTRYFGTSLTSSFQYPNGSKTPAPTEK